MTVLMQSPKLDELLAQLSATSGLYSRATFQNLYSSLVRIIRDQRLNGLIVTLTQEEDNLDVAGFALHTIGELDVIDLNQVGPDLPASIASSQLSLLLVLTSRLSACLYWDGQSEAAYRMVQGGWTFHPGDSRAIAQQLGEWLGEPGLAKRIADSPMDRRYDEKMTLLVASLVNNLEGRNRELALALQRESQLSQRVLESERLAAVGQLCSVVAHEIRNPLGLIDLYAKLTEVQLEQLGVEDEKLTEFLTHIRNATQDLDGILSELTQYSRPVELNTEPTDIVALVESVCDFVRPKYDEKKVVLEVLEPSLLSQGQNMTSLGLSVDPGKIRQALLNLLKNALEATDAEAAVRVQLASRQGDQQIYIKVMDEGCGVKPEAQAKLFTPYFSTKGNEGTGLGLAHVRKIMQAHGGNALLLKSEPNQGSTFALVLNV